MQFYFFCHVYEISVKEYCTNSAADFDYKCQPMRTVLASLSRNLFMVLASECCHEKNTANGMCTHCTSDRERVDFNASPNSVQVIWEVV